MKGSPKSKVQSPKPKARGASPSGKARYIMMGGFLGAGKTTAVARLAKRLADSGQRVGLITNDQGSELVDTAMLRSRGFATEEIPGGCFCCRFNSLVEAAERLSVATRPDVFIAEPVGSCTDLVATVTYPLRRMYGDNFTIGPLSVLVDPVRALRILGLEPGASFSSKVLYVYRKQLEEADLIVVNKIDLLDMVRLAKLRGALQENFPKAELFEISARNELGLNPWFERILAAPQSGGVAMEVDYDIYAEGEALLGWLNCTLQLSSAAGFDGNEFIRDLAQEIQRRLNASSVEVAHLKMTLSPREGLGDLAVINLVRNDNVPELSQTLVEPVEAGQLIVNLRAEADPGLLERAVDDSISELKQQRPQTDIKLDHLEHFRPGRPQPTHRITQLG